MNYNAQDRVRVARVSIARETHTEEIRGCWVALHPERKSIGIWTAPEATEPAYTARLVDVSIVWQEERREEMPLPTA